MSRRGFAKSLKRFDARTLNVERVIGDILTTSITADSINAGDVFADQFNFNQISTPVNFNSQVISNVNIQSGAVDGVIIGGTTPASGSFTSLTASGPVTLSGTVTLTGANANIVWDSANDNLIIPRTVDIGDLNINGFGAENIISSTTNDITIQPAAGQDINLNVSGGGTINGLAAAITSLTSLVIGDITLTNNIITTTDGLSDIILLPEPHAGRVIISDVDINAGNIDNTIIGALIPAIGTFTQLTLAGGAPRLSFTGVNSTNQIILQNGQSDALSITDNITDFIIIDSSLNTVTISNMIISGTLSSTAFIIPGGGTFDITGITSPVSLLLSSTGSSVILRSDVSTVSIGASLDTTQNSIFINSSNGGIHIMSNPTAPGVDGLLVDSTGNFTFSTTSTDIDSVSITSTGGYDINGTTFDLDIIGGTIAIDSDTSISIGTVTGGIPIDIGDIRITDGDLSGETTTLNIKTGAGNDITIIPDTTGTTDIQKVVNFTASGPLDIGAFNFRAATLTADSIPITSVVFTSTDGLMISDVDFTFITGTNTLNVPNIDTLNTTTYTGIANSLNKNIIPVIAGGISTSGAYEIDDSSGANYMTFVTSVGSEEIFINQNINVTGTNVLTTGSVTIDTNKIEYTTDGILTIKDAESTALVIQDNQVIPEVYLTFDTVANKMIASKDLDVSGVSLITGPISSGDIDITSGELNFLGPATGDNEINILPGLADALSIQISNADQYITFNTATATILTKKNIDAGSTNYTTTGIITGGSSVIDFVSINNGSITFTGGTGVNEMIIPEPLADALTIKDSSGDNYLRFDTTTGTEKIIGFKDLDLGANTLIAGGLTIGTISASSSLVVDNVSIDSNEIKYLTNGLLTMQDTTNNAWIIRDESGNPYISFNTTAMTMTLGQELISFSDASFGKITVDDVMIDGSSILYTNTTTGLNNIDLSGTGALASAFDINDGVNTYLSIDTAAIQTNFIAPVVGTTITATTINGTSIVSSDTTITGNNLSFNSAVSGDSVIDLRTNLGSALVIMDGLIDYMTFVTLTGSEKISMQKDLEIFSDLIVSNTTSSGTLTTTTGNVSLNNATLAFNAGNGINTVELVDNIADALTFRQATNDYLTFMTTDGNEKVIVGKTLDLGSNNLITTGTISGAGFGFTNITLDAGNLIFQRLSGQSKIIIQDSQVDALTIQDTLADQYITFNTTSNQVVYHKTLNMQTNTITGTGTLTIGNINVDSINLDSSDINYTTDGTITLSSGGAVGSATAFSIVDTFSTPRTYMRINTTAGSPLIVFEENVAFNASFTVSELDIDNININNDIVTFGVAGRIIFPNADANALRIGLTGGSGNDFMRFDSVANEIVMIKPVNFSSANITTTGIITSNELKVDGIIINNDDIAFTNTTSVANRILLHNTPVTNALTIGTTISNYIIFNTSTTTVEFEKNIDILNNTINSGNIITRNMTATDAITLSGGTGSAELAFVDITSGGNVITIPDNLSSALDIIKNTGGSPYMTFDTLTDKIDVTVDINMSNDNLTADSLKSTELRIQDSMIDKLVLQSTGGVTIQYFGASTENRLVMPVGLIDAFSIRAAGTSYMNFNTSTSTINMLQDVDMTGTLGVSNTITSDINVVSPSIQFNEMSAHPTVGGNSMLVMMSSSESNAFTFLEGGTTYVNFNTASDKVQFQSDVEFNDTTKSTKFNNVVKINTTVATALTANTLVNSKIISLDGSTPLNMPTAMNIVAEVPNATVGDTIQILFSSEGAGDVTILPNIGVSINSLTSGADYKILDKESRIAWIRLDNVSSGFEAITLY